MGQGQESRFWLVLLACVLHFKAFNGQEDGFHNFLTNAMQNYPSWAVSKGLEPSPVLAYSVDISASEGMINITGDIRDQILIHHTDTGGRDVQSDLLGATFRISFFSRNFISLGKYTVEGTILGSIPVKGNGYFNLTNEDAYLDCDVVFSDFGITSNGYIDLSVGQIRQFVYGISYAQAELEGLEAGGYESNVIATILKKYTNGENIQEWLPVRDYLMVYFEELFAKTPLSEIIGTTLGPPTTPTTTEDPCNRVAEAKPSFRTVIHDENILQSEVITDANGQRKRVTTKIVKMTVTQDEL